MSNKTLFIASLGQVLDTKIDDSVADFAEATCLSEQRIRSAMFFDQFLSSWFSLFGGVSYIQSYKVGKIEDKQFCNGIRKRLGVSEEELNDQRLKECWNKMCKFSDDSKKEFANIFKNLRKDTNSNLVLVSGTNNMHINYIKEQLEKIDGYEAVREQLNFVNSHKFGIVGDKYDLAKRGIEFLQVEGSLPDEEINNIVSFHNHILTEKLFGKFAKKVIICINIQTDCGDEISEKMSEARKLVNNQCETLAA